MIEMIKYLLLIIIIIIYYHYYLLSTTQQKKIITNPREKKPKCHLILNSQYILSQ